MLQRFQIVEILNPTALAQIEKSYAVISCNIVEFTKKKAQRKNKAY